MATVANNDLIEGLSGKLGKFIVFRTMHGKTFASHRARKPDKKKESEAQRNTRVTFRQAAEWAKKILLDSKKKEHYQQRAKALKLPNAYTAAITDYMRKSKVVKTEHRGIITYAIHKPGFALRQVQAIVNETTGAIPQKIEVRLDKDRWFVHYTPDANSLSSITLIITDNAERKIQFRCTH